MYPPVTLAGLRSGRDENGAFSPRGGDRLQDRAETPVNIGGDSLPRPSSPDPGRPSPITETQQNRGGCQIPTQSRKGRLFAGPPVPRWASEQAGAGSCNFQRYRYLLFDQVAVVQRIAGNRETILAETFQIGANRILGHLAGLFQRIPFSHQAGEGRTGDPYPPSGEGSKSTVKPYSLIGSSFSLWVPRCWGI